MCAHVILHSNGCTWNQTELNSIKWMEWHNVCHSIHLSEFNLIQFDSMHVVQSPSTEEGPRKLLMNVEVSFAGIFCNLVHHKKVNPMPLFM